ncbi:hypothetical protein NG796_17880 [Laspinema sp. A4]|uniref:hypothetical protein n=1 Tax=Laspinema sp. D2d TaxID=2953686 RepID=UPI0021BBAC8F|nr:hypothetical protein [Laspinema sp. D2d]MCT7985146.1 hypothetical protein [Laspinema sp. D2d]
MNPEDSPKVDNPDDKSSSPRYPESNLGPDESESVEELNAIAKALMVNLLWSQVGLMDEKNP